MVGTKKSGAASESESESESEPWKETPIPKTRLVADCCVCVAVMVKEVSMPEPAW